MKISKLPQEIREKALEYQRNETLKTYLKKTDDLVLAFSWTNTEEGSIYWCNWDSKKFEYDSNGVTKPKQYQIGIDTFAIAEANLTKDEIIAVCKFNIDKYCWRIKNQDKEDFKKIIDYANWALKQL